MSNYENYSSTAGSYDGTRSATGYESILGMATAAGLTGGGVLLDAGCGTGNYAAALVPFFSQIEAVDMSAKMLDVAREKLAQYASLDKVRLHQGVVDDLPLPSDSADVAMLNQVLHHLPVEPQWSAHACQGVRRTRAGGTERRPPERQHVFARTVRRRVLVLHPDPRGCGRGAAPTHTSGYA
ncbi:MAG: class I SAM-dependent methyltransferase [Chromatiales bacterium]|nr:class I SAM-dependent methyltransferase [Chromatiales bacterium]